MTRMLLTAFTALFATGIAPGASAAPTTVTVDCDRGQTIANALQQGDFRKALVINVRGTCNGSILIDRDNVTLHGDPGATINATNPNTDVVTVNANGVRLEYLTLAGGYYGVRNDQVFRLYITNTVIQDASSDGVRIFVGDTRITNSTIRRAGGNGVYVTRGGSLGASNSRFIDNAGTGVYAYGNSTVSANGSEIRGNGTGVQLGAGSEGTFSNTTVTGNNGVGITVASSQAIVGSNNVITNNTAWGVWVFSGASATIYGNRIEDNGWDGISGDVGTTMVLNDNAIRRNGAFGIACRMNCTIEEQGDTLESNAAGGVLVEEGSKLRFVEDATHWTGDGWGLQCSDKESSVNNLGLFDGLVSDTCSDFDH